MQDKYVKPCKTNAIYCRTNLFARQKEKESKLLDCFMNNLIGGI